MTPGSQPRKVKNSSKINLTVSVIVHIVLVLVLFYFAAREGLLGKKMQKISVNMVKEKPPEKPKEPEKPKVEPPKVIEQPKIADIPKVAPPAAPPVVAPPVVAPPAVDVPGFEFEGGKAVNSESDPVQLYKGYMEYALRQKWDRPENLPDENYIAEVAVNLDRQGNISQSQWLKGSGDKKWDDSVKQVFKVVQRIDRKPPTNFPPQVTIRFDVQEQTEPVLQ